jgi:hypothetical protein
VVRHIFQACPVWKYTQSNITSIISGKYPANLYRIPDSAGCLNFTGYRIPVSGSGTSLKIIRSNVI